MNAEKIVRKLLAQMKNGRPSDPRDAAAWDKAVEEGQKFLSPAARYSASMAAMTDSTSDWRYRRCEAGHQE
ncbi:MAG: hypothetical protein AAGG48_14725 [Planctomycetota bacterium]